jgi:capsular exopolysaccharide synthesis family protein
MILEEIHLEKLEIYKKDSFVLKDAFDEAVVNLHILKRQNGYKSFAICGCEAGDGNTTIAISLAVALADSGWKTVLIDGDMRKKNKYKRLNENAEAGLSDYLMGKSELDKVIYETTTENLSYIPCGELIDNPVRLLCSGKMDDARGSFATLFDYIIFDMPAINVAADAKAIATNADATILVSAMGKTTKKGLVEAANTLIKAKANLIGTIVNKIDMDQYVDYHEDYDYFQNKRYAQEIKKKNK